jgi:hypothetical protein
MSKRDHRRRVGSKGGNNNSNNTDHNKPTDAPIIEQLPNIIYGYNSGKSVSGHGNIIFGYRTANNLTNGCCNVILGDSFAVDQPDGDHQVMLGGMVIRYEFLPSYEKICAEIRSLLPKLGLDAEALTRINNYLIDLNNKALKSQEYLYKSVNMLAS